MFESWRERAEELETEVYALGLALRHPRAPLAAKAVMALVVAYAVSPVDPIPDFIPVVGLLDDLVVVPAGVALSVRLLPPDVLAECRRRATENLNVGRTRWLVGAVVVCVWVGVTALAVRAFTPWL